MSQRNFTTFNENREDDLDLGTIARHILMQSKLVLTIVLIVFSVSLAIYFNSTKKYEIVSLVQVEAFNENIFDPTNTLQLAGGSLSGGSTDIDNLISLYKSRTNILKLINDLNLSTEIFELDNEEYVIFNIKSQSTDGYYSNVFYVEFEEKEYSIYDEDNNFLDTIKYGEIFTLDDGSEIVINDANLNRNRKLKFVHTNPSSLFNSLSRSIELISLGERSYFGNSQGLIQIKYVTPDIKLGKEIIDYANQIFLEQRIYNETSKSRAAINFIEENIQSLEKVVESNKRKLKEFREKNGSIDVDLETQAILSKIQDIDKALVDIEFDVINAKEIYTDSNPIFINLINRKNILQNQRNSILLQIENMPMEQQQLIDLYNEVEISQTLFEELETRRLAFSIMEASTIGDIKIVDSAYLSSLVSPNIFTTILATFISFIIACFVAIIRGNNFLPLSNPAEIIDNNINQPLVGVLPLVTECDAKDADEISLDLKFNSALESLVVNIKSIQGEKYNQKCISFTSASPGNGKSTISIHTAIHLAKIGKKVLLIDSDLKRGDINNSFGVRKINKKTFFEISKENIESYKIKENLYLIPRVRSLTNSFEFVCSPSYKDKINELKNNFDYVIFDTAPILSVADTSVIIEKSDLNFLVVRHDMNKINQIKQSINNFDQIGVDLSGIIYNAYAKPKGYYGYYGVYGDYAYQYYAEKYLSDSYDYKKDE